MVEKSGCSNEEVKFLNLYKKHNKQVSEFTINGASIHRQGCDSSLERKATFMFSLFKEGFYELSLDNLFTPDVSVTNEEFLPINCQVSYLNEWFSSNIYALILTKRLYSISISVPYFDRSVIHDILDLLPMLFVGGFRTFSKKCNIKVARHKDIFLEEEAYKSTVILIEESQDKTKDQVLAQKLRNAYDQL